MACARATLDAAPARHERAGDDAVARLDVADLVTDRFHLAAELVSHDQRWRPAGAAGRDRLDLRAADADSGDPQDDFARRGARRWNVTDLERVPGGVDERFHG